MTNQKLSDGSYLKNELYEMIQKDSSIFEFLEKPTNLVLNLFLYLMNLNLFPKSSMKIVRTKRKLRPMLKVVF